MLSVVKEMVQEPVHVHQILLEIPMIMKRDATESANRATIVHRNWLALVSSVPILVQTLVARYPSVTSSNTFQYALVLQNTREIHTSPCGPNSKCREVNSQAVCTCLPEYRGIPPNCRPECVVNAECPPHLACLNKKCTDPCPNTCGVRALCTTKNHNPICTCPVGFTGDPFFQCSPDYIGVPPECRPECILSSECKSHFACVNQKCKDPCPGSCGVNAQCHVVNHIPVCTCMEGFTGDPFAQCRVIPPSKILLFISYPY